MLVGVTMVVVGVPPGGVLTSVGLLGGEAMLVGVPPGGRMLVGLTSGGLLPGVGMLVVTGRMATGVPCAGAAYTPRMPKLRARIAPNLICIIDC